MTSKNKNKRLVLLDSHAILHRAYHALPDFTSSSGEPTGALYGLSTMLLKIIKELSPDYVIATYDVAKPTYRHEVFKDYKAGRKKTEDSLVEQIKRSEDIFEAFGIPIYKKEGYEADDVLGTIVERLKDKDDLEIIIATGDMDTLQLVDGRKVKVYTLRKGIKDTIIYDEKAVKERFKFPPEYLPDYKGLRGDPSDNIPGVKGVGEKTATTLIKSYGTVEDIYEALEKDEEKFIEKTSLTKRIAGLLNDNKEEAQFSKVLGEIHTEVPIEVKLPKEEFMESVDEKKVFELFSRLSFRSIKNKVEEIFGVQQRGEEKIQNEDINKREVKEAGIALWLLDSTISNPKLEDILSYTKTNDFQKAKKKLLNDLKDNELEKVYKEIELPLIEVVEKMENRGINIDTAFLKKLSTKYHKELEKQEKKIYTLAGEEFNINSPKQLGEVLYEKLKLGGSKIKKTSTGSKSTRESELRKLLDEHEIISHILEYREFQKLLSTYIDNLPDQISEDGRLRANFIQTGTTTGRMSSHNPNLQNIPIKTKRGREIRKAFAATRGFQMVAFDYSQIELRIAAMISGDKKLVKFFKDGKDIHSEVAAEIFNIPPEKVGKAERSKAKVINFGILYGMGVNALSSNLEVSRKEAQKYISEYFKRFPGLNDYIEKAKADAHIKGYAETYFGRKRFLKGIKSRLPYIKAEAERQAVNAPIQGTQADIIKIAMSRIDELLRRSGKEDDCHLLIQVHDELVYEIKNNSVDEISKKIKKAMESVLSSEDAEGIKFVSSVEGGPNWGDMEGVQIE